MTTVRKFVSSHPPPPHHPLSPLPLLPLSPWLLLLRLLLLPLARLWLSMPLAPHPLLQQTMLGPDERTCACQSGIGTMLHTLGNREREGTWTHFQSPSYRSPPIRPPIWSHHIRRCRLMLVGSLRVKLHLSHSILSTSRQHERNEKCLAFSESTAGNLFPNMILRLRSTANFF